MKKWILNNWPLKLISVMAAVALWFVVITVTDPTDSRIFVVPVEFVNQDVLLSREKAVRVIDDQYVRVRVTKNRSVINSMSVSNFVAEADFTKMYEDTQVPVTVTVKDASLQDADFTQDKYSLEVELEDLEKLTVPITYELDGETAEGYAVDEVTLSPDSVTIVGPESYIRLVRTVKVVIDTNKAQEDFSVKTGLVILDGNGTVLKPGETEDTSIDVNGKISCDVRMALVKKVPVIVEPTGIQNTAEGFEYVGSTVAPDTVTISGTKAVIGQISSILIDDIDLSGMRNSSILEADLIDHLPDGVKILDGEAKASVSVMIEPIVKREFLIPTSRVKVINLDEGLQYRIAASRVKVVVSGLESDMEKLHDDEIIMTIDMEGCTNGSFNRSMTVELPSDSYQLVEAGRVTVSIDREDEL